MVHRVSAYVSRILSDTPLKAGSYNTVNDGKSVLDLTVKQCFRNECCGSFFHLRRDIIEKHCPGLEKPSYVHIINMFDDLLQQVFQRSLLEEARLKVERSELGEIIVFRASPAVRPSCNASGIDGHLQSCLPLIYFCCLFASPFSLSCPFDCAVALQRDTTQ